MNAPFLTKYLFLTCTDEDDLLADLLADNDDFPSSQRNSVAARDKRNIIDNLFDVKISNESLSNPKPGKKKNSLMSVLHSENLSKQTE